MTQEHTQRSLSFLYANLVRPPHIRYNLCAVRAFPAASDGWPLRHIYRHNGTWPLRVPPTGHGTTRPARTTLHSFFFKPIRKTCRLPTHVGIQWGIQENKNEFHVRNIPLTLTGNIECYWEKLKYKIKIKVNESGVSFFLTIIRRVFSPPHFHIHSSRACLLKRNLITNGRTSPYKLIPDTTNLMQWQMPP